MDERVQRNDRKSGLGTEPSTKSVLQPGGSHVSAGMPWKLPQKVEQYEYLPLASEDEIRLLKFLPGREQDELQCDIIHFRLSCARQPKLLKRIYRKSTFEALSYCWGDTGARDHVRCGLKGRVVSATPNCVAALRRLRLKARYRLLWVDALCINQKDIVERNQQLRLMSRIYNAADVVLIYLGETTEDSDYTIDLIESHSRKPETFHCPTDDEKCALTNFFSRPWFFRVWVLQEVAWSRSATLICGERSVSWKNCLGVSKYSWTQPDWWFPASTNNPAMELPLVVRLTCESAIINAYTPKALLNVLLQTRNCLSTDPRDKIFALLPLFDKRGVGFPVADYQSSVVQTYTSISAMLLRDHGPDILSTIIPSKVEKLPSWVTDWSLPPATNRLSFKKILEFYLFKPSCFSSFHPEIVIEFKAGGSAHLWSPTIELPRESIRYESATLVVNGIEFDKIQAGTTECNIKIKGWDYLIFTLWPRMLAADDARRIQDGNYIRDCYKTMILMSNTEENRWHPPISRLKYYFENRASFDIDDLKGEGMYKTHRRAEMTCHRRSLLRTRGGLICLGPPESRTGDIIFVIEGAPTPFILRRSGSDFCFIGECYVPGIMQGQLLQRKGAKSMGQTWTKVKVR